MGIHSDVNASYKLLAKELEALGYSMSKKVVNNHLYVTYRSPSGSEWMTRAALIRYPFTSEKVMVLSKDKAEAADFIRSKGLSAPAALKIEKNRLDHKKIEKMIERHGKVVVKPLDRSLSMGLTTDITTMPKAITAMRKAFKYSNTILMQEQVFGEEIRFAVVDGKVSAALLRRTPRVIGDGTSTIKELIKVENDARKKIDYSLTKYPQLTRDMIDKKIDLKKVPKADEIVELSRSTMISRGCSVYDVLDKINQGYIDIVESMVEGMESDFLVADVFIRDYKQPATEKNYWFIEFNTAPVLKVFYSCRDGNMHDILPTLAQTIDKKIHALTYGQVVGSFEPVNFKTLGITNSIAKIDTGAFSGAIGCRNIRVIRRGGIRYLQFSPGKRSKKIIETSTFHERFVRSSSGHRQKRYMIETEIKIRNRTYPITIGISDRTEMKHEILIGRRFLRENHILVDVRINQEYDTDRESK